jgi:hypothetical protein
MRARVSRPSAERWRREGQALNLVRNDPLQIDRVSELSLTVTDELADEIDGSERVVAVAIQRPYMRHVSVP